VNLLQRSKYSFFNILSFAYSRAEAKMLLSRISKRGSEYCNDSYLDIFAPLTFNIEIRDIKLMSYLLRFNDEYQKEMEGKGIMKFDDEISLGVFLDFKRESSENLLKLLKGINSASSIKFLTVGGSPNPKFSDNLFQMLLHNNSLRSLSVNLEWIPDSSYQHLQSALMKNTALREFRLENCSMTNTNMEHLVQGLGLNSQKNMRSI
jgi:hypothetical protein